MFGIEFFALSRDDLLRSGICTAVALVLWHYCGFVFRFVCETWSWLLQPAPPLVTVEPTKEEAAFVLDTPEKFDPSWLDTAAAESVVHKWDPATFDYFGKVPAMSGDEVRSKIILARQAQEQWSTSSSRTRRLLMRTMLRFITENQEAIAKVAVRESGKTVIDAMVGEILVTCEKLKWLAARGEQALRPEEREAGTLMMMKRAYVEWVPLGVIGAIVPWNYPFHNVFNPVSASLFAGNAIVVKVSEHASWSIDYYGRIIDACLDAVGAPRGLVQFVVGYGSTGAALMGPGGVDQVIFVGSPDVGAIVAKQAASTLTPVVLELGGKDAFVVCDDADISSIVHVACRGVWQNAGQNCAGPERFLVYDKVFDEFCDAVVKIVQQMQQGSPLANPGGIDCGAITAGPRQCQRFQSLVDDAVSKGAKLLAGGKLCDGHGSFYPPTVLADVPESADIAKQEIFGPIMCIMRVKGNSDDEAVRIANNSEFGLSSCAFSGSAARAKRVAARLRAGMSAVNDLEGTTYMNQSLPFGGWKRSGYGRFAGPEGLRGLCLMRSVCEDKFSFIRNSIPPPLKYPASATGAGHNFAQGLIGLFYSETFAGRFRGLIGLLSSLFAKAPSKKSQ